MVIKILGGLSIAIGAIGVFGGMLASLEQMSAIGTVVGGGFFMMLGVTAFILSRK